jgi:hypothetical protein
LLPTQVHAPQHELLPEFPSSRRWKFDSVFQMPLPVIRTFSFLLLASTLAADIEVPVHDKAAISDEQRNWWAFRPLEKVPPPTLSPGGVDGLNSIDAFLIERAGKQNVSLSPRADRRTLARRAYLDLLGLPPSPDELERFVRDDAPDAWARLIDRLLASPHYGERWARHWLDVARFAESSGFEHDYDRPGAYHYRDFVIKALNADLPFDQFAHWQLAGDEFEPENPLALAATGFLGAGVFPTQITANEVERTRYDAMDDMLSTTGSAFLGLTIGCARCHDHKYDPIPSADYYRMLSTFTTTVRSVIDLDVDPSRTRAQQAVWEKEHEALLASSAQLEAELRPVFEDWLGDGVPPSSAPAWSLLQVNEPASSAGAKFRKLEDGSYLVEGKNADQDEYVFLSAALPARITALRLDALSHPSMKAGGPGRADNGNIGLSRIRMTLVPASGATQEVAIVRAIADFEQNKVHLSVAAALDDNPGTGWAVDPQFGKDHSAVFVLREPLLPRVGDQLRVHLEFRLNARHNIGRPRLSVTSDTDPKLEGEVVPDLVAALLKRLENGEAAKLNVSDKASLFDWWKTRHSTWRDQAKAIADHTGKKPDGRTKVLVCAEGYTPLRMHTQGADFFNETFFLKRGNADLKDGVASPGFLQVLMRAPSAERWSWQPPPGAKYSGRRRAFAQWLTDLEAGAGALAARVAVNRLWQHHFGQGIVSTPNDFGRTGTPPTHPDLLEWLAGELVRNGWKLKPMHRLIMTSAAYRQSSAVDEAKAAVDPDNHLFVRQVPRRLEGEAIRDSMLAVSGVMDRSLFGEGTKNERSRRRSIYFTIKRSQLVGSMVAFDQPEPLVSQGARPTTTVAPQALFLLNGPQVREWAEAFARRVLVGSAGAGGFGSLIGAAYREALGRLPTSAEAGAALTFLKSQTESYTAGGLNEPEFLAMADFCQVIFGLNEFAYIP